MAAVLELASYRVSSEVVHALETMLMDAKEGKLTELVLVAKYVGMELEYILDVAGVTTELSATYFRGLLPELDFELAKIVRRGAF